MHGHAHVFLFRCFHVSSSVRVSYAIVVTVFLCFFVRTCFGHKIRVYILESRLSGVLAFPFTVVCFTSFSVGYDGTSY